MKKKKKIYIWIINLFILLAVIVLAASAYLTLATATILIPMNVEEFKHTIMIDVSSEQNDDTVYGDFVSREYEVSGTFSIGAITTEAGKAGGVVTIINTSSRNQPLVNTTRLLTSDNKLFRITKTIQVPAGQSVDVFAEADQAGDEFNLETATKFTIPGLSQAMQTLIYAESKGAMTRQRSVASVVTEDDLNNAKAELTEKLVTKALNDLTPDLPDGFVINKEQLAVNLMETTSDPKVGQEATEVVINLKSQVSALLLNPTDITELVENKLISALPDPERLLRIVPDSLTYSIATIDTEVNTAQVSTELTALVSSEKIVSQLSLKHLTGKSAEEARMYIMSQGIQNAEIKLFPAWPPILPLLENHIKVEAK